MLMLVLRVMFFCPVSVMLLVMVVLVLYRYRTRLRHISHGECAEQEAGGKQ
jgi:hypothetical protein